MPTLDPDNCIRLFRPDDSEDPTSPENVVVIPAGNNVLRSIFHPECKERQPTAMNTSGDCTFPEEGVDLLVKFRHELEELFQDCGEILGIADVLWEDISRRLFDRGFTVTGKQCAAKWEALYSEYLDVAHSDDEGRVSGWKHFIVFEYLYKKRSKYIDSKILEDIKEYLDSRSESPASTSCSMAGMDLAAKSSKGVEVNPLKKSPCKREFSTLTNEKDGQILNEAIAAPQTILKKNPGGFDDEFSGETETKEEDIVENCCWRYNNSLQFGAKSSGGEGEASLFLEQKKIHLIPDKKRELDTRVLVWPENTDFVWDKDATQCFIDFRLYVETSKPIKQNIMKKYKTIFRFLSQKMSLNGYKLSEADCRKKWEQLMRYYNKEAKKIKKRGAGENHLQGVRNYFLQIDRVLKKSGLEISRDNGGNFRWDEEAIRKLIAIRIPMESAFAMFKRYVILWQYVASQMEKHKFSPTYNECSIKWMELREIYEACEACVKKGIVEDNVYWIFYHDMRQGFEKNAKNPEAVINYKCIIGPSTGMEESAESLASPASFSGSETPGGIETDSNNGNGTNSQNLRTDVSQNALNITVQQYNLSENMMETNEKDNVAGEPKAPDSPLINYNPEISTLRDSYPLEIDDNSLVKAARSETLCIEVPAGPEKQSSQSLSDVKDNGVDNARKNQSMADNRGNLSPGNEIMIRPEPRAQLKLTELPVTRSSSRLTKNLNRIDRKEGKFVWTNEAIINLVRLKLSKDMISLKKYGLPLANKMHSAGFPTVTSDDVTRKWSNIRHSYKESLIRMATGLVVRWRYFELVDTYVKGVTSDKESLQLNKNRPFLWTPSSVQKLINLKLLMGNFSAVFHCEGFLLWKRVANAMVVDGFQVTDADCRTEWQFLVKIYMKTKKELQSGNDAVIKKYFFMMNKAMNKLNRSNNGMENVDNPIDFSVGSKKRKLEDSVTKEDNIHRDSSVTSNEVNENWTLGKKVCKNDSPKTIDENVANLSLKTIVPNPSNHTPVESSSVMKELAENNSSVNSRVNLCHVSSFNKEKKVLPVLKSELELANDDYVDSSKENVDLIGNKTRYAIPCATDTKAKINLLNSDLLTPSKKNVLIQDRAVNSTENLDGEDTNREWSEAATHLLIDSKIEHNEKFAVWPRPEIDWGKVADQLARLGHNYTRIECEKKWHSLKTIYERMIANIEAKKTVQTWPYFGKMDSFYMMLGNRYHGFRFILPRKRGHDEEQPMSPKRLIVSMKPSQYSLTPSFVLRGTGNEIKVEKVFTVNQEKRIE